MRSQDRSYTCSRVCSQIVYSLESAFEYSVAKVDLGPMSGSASTCGLWLALFMSNDEANPRLQKSAVGFGNRLWADRPRANPHLECRAQKIIMSADCHRKLVRSSQSGKQVMLLSSRSFGPKQTILLGRCLNARSSVCGRTPMLKIPTVLCTRECISENIGASRLPDRRPGCPARFV
jgi:hypothetical protein